MLTGEELITFAKEFLDEHFGLKLTIPIVWNNRTYSTHGSFFASHYNPNLGRPLRIELSKKIAMEETDEFTLDTLKHELCHYACYVLGLPYKDGTEAHTNACLRTGAPLTRTRRAKLKSHVYVCSSDCSYPEHRTVRRFNRNLTYKCKRCGHTLTYSHKEE